MLPLSRCRARRGKLTVRLAGKLAVKLTVKLAFRSGAVQHCDQLIDVVCLCRKNRAYAACGSCEHHQIYVALWSGALLYGCGRVRIPPFCPPSLASLCKRSSVVCWLGRTFLSCLWYVPATRTNQTHFKVLNTVYNDQKLDILAIDVQVNLTG